MLILYLITPSNMSLMPFHEPTNLVTRINKVAFTFSQKQQKIDAVLFIFSLIRPTDYNGTKIIICISGHANFR